MYINYGVEQLGDFGKEIMEKAGLLEKEAKLFVDSLLAADMRGISSHGISRFALGVTIGLEVMDLCIEGARKYGSCSAAVRNGNHFAQFSISMDNK